jgi:zinc protease
VTAGLRVAVLVAAAQCACAARAVLPEPTLPLSRTSEEAFRARRPRQHTRGAWLPPTLERWQTRNGIRVLFAQRAGSGMVSIGYLNLRAAYADAPAESGTASLTASLLTRGTRAHPGDSHARALRQLGVSLRTDCNPRSVEVSVSVESRDMQRATDLLAEAVTEPALGERDFSLLLSEQSEERRLLVVSPSTLGITSAVRMLYSEQHPFLVSRTGTLAQINARTLADVRRFHRERYTPEHSAIVVAGDIARASVEQLVERSFGSWSVAPTALPAAFVPGPAPRMPVPWRLYDHSSDNAMLFVAWRFPALLAADFADGLVLDNIFGGTLSSRMARALRDATGIAYSPASERRGDGRDGYLVAGVSMDVSNVRPAIELMIREADRLRARRPSAAEVRAAQEYLRNELFARFETVEGVRDALAGLVVFNLGPESWPRHIALIDAVTPSSVHVAAQRYMQRDAMSLVLVADQHRVGRTLLELSPYGALLEEVSP